MVKESLNVLRIENERQKNHISGKYNPLKEAPSPRSQSFIYLPTTTSLSYVLVSIVSGIDKIYRNLKDHLLLRAVPKSQVHYDVRAL